MVDLFNAPSPRGRQSVLAEQDQKAGTQTMQAAAAEAVAAEAAQRIADQAKDAFRTDAEKRFANLSGVIEALRLRVVKLEERDKIQNVAPPAAPDAPQASTVVNPTTAPTAPEFPIGAASAAPGNPVEGMPTGEHKGKFLRKKKDESDADFQTRFGLTPAEMSWWKQHQEAEDKKLGN